MAKLSDSQLVILAAAARRDDRAVHPLPRSLKTRGAALTRTLEGLIAKGLLEERAASSGAEIWREDEDGTRLMLAISEAGLKALDGGSGSTSPEPSGARKSPARPPRKAAVNEAADEPTPRPGTKLARVIALLKRRNGATIDEIVKATDWQPHSVRGAISGALRKKLGLAVISEKVEGRGRVYRIGGRG